MDTGKVVYEGEKKKFAVLTFTDTPNYGALLQAYALQKYLNETGKECKVIDYQNAKRKYSQVSGVRKIRSIVWRCTFSKLFVNQKRKERTKWFKTFLLNQTGRTYKNLNGLKSLNNYFDGFIVGSDQVWNPSNNNEDSAYLLSFSDSDKIIISYSASFGTKELNKKYLIDNEKYFRRFNYISVREQTGKDMIEDIVGMKAVVTVDPVFLLSKDYWKHIVNQFACKGTRENYILCYVLPGNKNVEKRIYDIASEIAKKTGAPILTIGKKTISRGYSRERLIHDCGPLEFLSYLMRATVVVTNSFHGTAFSIINEKRFWCVLGRGIEGRRNTRIENLLESMNLRKRAIECGEEYNDIDFLQPIEYSLKWPIIQESIDKSKEYLDNATR